MKSWKTMLSPRLVVAVGFVLFLVLAGLLLLSPADSVAEDHSPVSWIAESERKKVDLSVDLQTLDGQPVNLGDLENKALFLNFWATWCGPCRAEMPSMAVLHDQLEARGLSIVAVTDEDPELVRGFLERNPYPFSILIDSSGTLLDRFGVRVLPTTLIIDSQSRLAYSHQGAIQWDTPEIRDRFEKLLTHQ